MAVDMIERDDHWMNKARCLRLRLRDRFRVAVDKKRRQEPIFPDGYFLLTMRLWMQRFSDFRRDSLPSSSRFYLKRVSKDFKEGEESAILRMLQALAVPVIGNVCHVFMHGLNRVQVYGLEKLHEAVLRRPKDKPLVTVSNHVASVDDPFVIAALLPPHILLDAQNMRWTLCASDRCFRNSMFSAFSQTVKVLPVSRGDGVYQKGMDMAISKLNHGGWVHIFPEGSRSRDGGKTMGSSKRGIGRLLLDADSVPLVVPFVHTGMQDIMPVGANFPRIGKTVTVLVGDPIEFDDLLNVESAVVSRGDLYDAVASRVGHRLLEMKVQVDKLELDQAIKLQHHSVHNTERAIWIFQQVDWESFGMESFISHDNLSIANEDIQVQPHKDVTTYTEQPTSNWYASLDFSRGGGFLSRMRSFVDPTEFMGFAARGLFTNYKTKEFYTSSKELAALRAWKQFLDSGINIKINTRRDENIASTTLFG